MAEPASPAMHVPVTVITAPLVVRPVPPVKEIPVSAPRPDIHTHHLVVDPERPDPGVVESAAEILRGGGLVAFPTETVYGLGVDARDRDAVRRLFTAKGRPADNPLIVHVARSDDVAQVAREVPALAKRLMETFWPGPLTIVLPRRPEVPDETTAGLDTVGVRQPDHAVARALIAAAGRPLAAPSANRSGAPSPTTGAHVLHDLGGRIDAVLDAGPCRVGLESTVVVVDDGTVTVLRLGAVTPEMLLEVAPNVVVSPHASGVEATGEVPSPGMKHRHYAPRARLRVYDGPDRLARLEADRQEAKAAGERVGIVATRDSGLEGPDVIQIAARTEPALYAEALYGTLRALDEKGVDQILVEGIEPVGIGAAVMDRLRRAGKKE